MKRDIDLVRELLFYVEKEFDPSEGPLRFSLQDMPEELTNEHAPATVLRHIELV